MKKLLIFLIISTCAVLLLGSCQHEHTPAEAVKKNVVHATCSEDGSYDSVVGCTGCSAILSSETVRVPATGEHTRGEAVIRGEYMIVRCEKCGEDLASTPIPVKNHVHTHSDAVVENEIKPTCESDGSYQLSVYCTDPECGFVASRDIIVVPALEHEPVGPNEEGDYLVVRCGKCNTILASDIIIPEPHEHTPEVAIENKVAPNCYVGGSYDIVEYCSFPHCHEELYRETCYTGTIPHAAAAEPVLEEDFYVYRCIYCDMEMLRTPVSTEPVHIPSEVVLTDIEKPTCDGVGKFVYTQYCSIEDCTEHISEFVMLFAPLGHNFVNGICTTCAQPMAAATVDGLTFKLSADGTYYTLVLVDKDIAGDVVIPAIYNSLPVKAIEKGAFYECELVTSVVIPEGIESIAANAFRGCTALVSVVIPEGVSEIGAFAFYGCEALVGASLPVSLETLGTAAFANCSSLIGIRVDDKNTVYRTVNGILYTADMLTLLQYPAGNANAHLTVPYFVETISEYAFAGARIDTVALPESVKTVCSHAFIGSSVKNIVFPEGLVSIGDFAFRECEELVEISLPDGTLLGSYVFFGCTSITSFTVPDYMTSVPVGMLAYCTSLESLVIHGTVTRIEANAFRGCESIDEIIIPLNVEFIGDYAFADNTDILVYYEGNVADWFELVGEDSTAFDEEAVIFYYSEYPKFDELYGYWHYDDEGKINVWDSKDIFS